jgi:hypothetical protein
LTKTKIAGFDCTQVLAPLVVGITGHRDIRGEDCKALADKVREIFVTLRKDYDETPLILVSPLAEGADRLAAEAALSANVGVRLVVPLPMPIELYEMDFDHVLALETPLATVIVDGNSREEFRALLDRATTRFELGLAHGNTYEKIAQPGPARDRQYELVGKYIAQQSQILIALWDGVESSRVGGTASVVQLQKEGVPGREICELEAPEGFPVYHVLTPRVKNPYPQGEVFGLRPIYPKAFEADQGLAEKYYRNMFSRLNEFNRYIVHSGHDLEEGIAKSKSYVLQDTREDELPTELGPALNRYAVADALAIRFQKRWLRAQLTLHALILGAFTSFLLFADQPKRLVRFHVISIILVTAAMVLRTSSRRRALDALHEDYRAMAEGLRVKLFWRLAGIKDAIADHYLGKQRSELDWIRNGFRGWNVEEGRQNHEKAEALDDDEKRSRLGFVRKYWIDDQLRYFRKAAESKRRSHEDIERIGRACMIGVAVLAVVLLALRVPLPAGVLKYLHAPMFESNFEWLAIGVEVLLAIAAILHHFNNRMAYSEHAKQYQRMASLFAHGSELLGQFLEREDYKNAYQCVKNVGDEALTENGDWVLLHRERPLEVPHP